ncbi:MAG TPA: hypothetical protein VFG43_03980 [Geminicoccaceae bacterium]|nr:hypothetical protein [Geminicoccaceae bacterium]
MVQARHAPEAPVGTLAAGDGPALAAAEHLLFAFAPAARLVASRWPVDQIWRANQGDMPEDRPLALEPRGARLLVHRDGEGDVAWFRLARADFALLRALHAGDTLGRALCFARAAEPAFDPLPLLRALIQAEVLLDAVLLMPLERIR